MNNIRKLSFTERVRGFCKRFSGSVQQMWNEIIPHEWLIEEVQKVINGRRERIYDQLQTLQLFIEQVLQSDHGCRAAVSQNSSERVAIGKSPCSANTGSYCKARIRLNKELIVNVTKKVGADLCNMQPAEWKWRGRELKLIDGTTVSMPDTKENQAAFPQNKKQEKGLGFPIARIVGIISLSCCAMLDWAVGACEGKETGEPTLLWQIASHFNHGDVVIADRCYTSYFLISLLIMRGVDVIFRQHQQRKTDFRLGKRLGKCDHIVEWNRTERPKWMDKATYDLMPKTLTMREIRVGNWIIVTTLTNAKEVSKVELNSLYDSRWNIELDIRSIKSVMQMDILRCKSPEMIRKEIAVHFLAYNLIRATMLQAAHIAQLLPRQLSFKGAMVIYNEYRLQFWNPFLQNVRDWFSKMLWVIAKEKLPKRPGRVEPRMVKRRPKPRTRMMKPREVLRKELLESRQKIIGSLSA